MRQYVGSFDAETKRPIVHVEEDGTATPLTAHGLLTEFGWGYNGRQTMELAYALCFNALDGDVALTERVARVYKHRLIHLSPEEGFRITQADVLARIVAINEVLNDRVMRPAKEFPL